jgi:phosphoribosylanthranilate isomerase
LLSTLLFRIKICGITNLDDARAAVAAGADAIGLNFFARSPRHVAPAVAKEICAALPAAVAKVGVFVNETPQRILELQAEVGFDVIQLHGDETPELVLQLGELRLVKAFRMGAETCEQVLAFAARCAEFGRPLAGVLIDAHAPGEYGGTGRTADWASAARVCASLADVPLILAGGLHPRNVAEAIRAVRPFGVDTASGVEAAPARKDRALVEAFVNAARNEL